jgi:repressor LexA
MMNSTRKSVVKKSAISKNLQLAKPLATNSSSRTKAAKPASSRAVGSRGSDSASTLNLTPKQQMILSFVRQFRDEHGYSASQREIADHFGFKSLGTIQNYLVRLKKQGAIEKEWNQKRDMTVSDLAMGNPGLSEEPPEVKRLPLVGSVAAGRPIEAIESQEWMDIPSSLAPGKGPFFILKVKGDSMIEDGILDGDFVIIRKQSTATNGQTVVALVENQATIKRFHKASESIELRAANPAYDPIIVRGAAMAGVHIEGILAGVMRRF